MKSYMTQLSLFTFLPFALLAFEITPVEPANNDVVPLLNQRQRQFLKMPRKERVAFFADQASRKELVKNAGYLPEAVSLVWKSDAPEDTVFTVKVSTKPDFSNAWIFTGKGTSRKVDNLEMNAKYYWKVSAGVGEESAVRTFRTEDEAPRLMRFPNVPNVRDLGGRKAMNGKRVRQNLVFRTAGLNDNARLTQKLSEGVGVTEVQTKTGVEKRGYVPGRCRVTKEGGDLMLKTFGVRSDIDLRSDRECLGMKGSPLGDSVTWFHYSSSAYGGMQTKQGKAAFTKVFKVFLDQKNYPIVFHCIAGQDRTGAVAFILNGLLGVSEEELYLDWESTGFWNPDVDFCHGRRFNYLVEGFQKLPGKTMNEKIEHYVLSLGFTKEDIALFRSIMLE